MVIVDLTGMA